MNENKPLDVKIEDSIYYSESVVKVNNKELIDNTEFLEEVNFGEPDFVPYK